MRPCCRSMTRMAWSIWRRPVRTSGGSWSPAGTRRPSSPRPGIAHLEVAQVTGSPEMLGGRVKTLHPKIHGGILADRSKPEHLDDLAANGIDAIDLVVSNLYPFSSEPLHRADRHRGPRPWCAPRRRTTSTSGIVTSPADYPVVLEELRTSGALSAATRRRLARAAFAHTAAYDAAIVAWLDAGGPTPVGGARRRHSGRRRGGRAVRSAPADPASHARAHRGAALRREPAPARLALPHRRRSELVGCHGAARWEPAVVPQPLRRRRRLAPGPRVGGATPVRDRRPSPSSSTPTRVAPPSPATSSPPTSARSSATCRAPSGAWWPSAVTSPPMWPTPSLRDRRPT